MHDRCHPLAGRMVRLPGDIGFGGDEFRIEDWWDRIAGESWRDAEGNPAALHYAARVLAKRLPANDDVVYGKVGALGYLMHVTEVEG
jgi:hypothetical protein